MTKIEHFFARYEEGANSFDPDLVCSQYTAEFMAAGPSGVMCGRNDDSLRKAIAQRHAFFKQIDTTNVASRLQALTRDLGTNLVASRALVQAIERENADVALLDRLTDRGAYTLRGRDTPLALWAGGTLG